MIKRPANTPARRRGEGVIAGRAVPESAGRWGERPVHGFVLPGTSKAGGPEAGRAAGWSAPFNRWGGGRGVVRGAVVTRPRAGARRRGRGGSATVALPLRSASSRVVGALHTRHERGYRGGEGWARWVEGRGGRDGSRSARAAQTSHHTGAIAHTEETRPRRPPNPTCRPTAGERVWGDCVSLARPAGDLAPRNWSRLRTDQRACVSSSHVQPVHRGAVPAR